MTAVQTPSASAAAHPIPAPLPATVSPPATDPFDAQWCHEMIRDVLSPIIEHWFRPQILGVQHIPSHGPVILASNHSGNALPYDAIVFDGFMWGRDHEEPARKLRTLYEPALSMAWWLRPFGVEDFWRRAGAVDMTFANFEYMLQRGDRLLYYPEGVPGIGKGFQNRYRLQPFKTSFILLAHRHRVPVVPVYTINAEWVMPFHFTIKWIDRIFQRVWGVPYLPLPAGVLAIFFPFLWYLALPARMIFVAREAIDVSEALREQGLADGEEPTKAQLRQAAERIRQRMQAELTELVQVHGKRQYAWRSLVDHLRRAGRDRWKALPTGWAFHFVRHERDRARGPARNRLHAFVRDLDIAAFYLPFGWPLLTLARRLRKPPYGYRGVPRADRERWQGHYLWRLSDQPLPPRPAP